MIQQVKEKKFGDFLIFGSYYTGISQICANCGIHSILEKY